MHFILNEKVSFDVAEKLVSCGKVRHTLSNPACRLLLILIENNHKIVTREELLQKVWSDFGLEPSGNSLNNNISILRKVLSDFGIHDALKTVPRTGFEMSLEDIKLSARSEDYLLVQSMATPVKVKNKKWLLWVGIGVLIFPIIHIIHYFYSDENFSDFSLYKKFQECSVFYNDDVKVFRVSSFFQDSEGKQLLSDCSSAASLYYDDTKVSKKLNSHEVFVAKCSLVKGGGKLECNNFIFNKKN